MLSRFDESSEPELFLDALEEIFRARQSLTPLEMRLGKFRALTTEKEDREKVFPKACVLLAKLKFSRLIDPANESNDGAAIVLSEKVKEAVNFFNDAAKQEEERKERGKLTPYHAYPPAYPLVEVIPLIFKVDDPVKVICEYMEALGPTKFYRHLEDCWFSDEERFSVTDEMQDFFLMEILCPLAPYSSRPLTRNSMKETMQGDASAGEFWSSASPIVMLLDVYFSGGFDEAHDEGGVFNTKFSDEEQQGDAQARKQKIVGLFFASLRTYEGFLTIFFGGFFDFPQGLFVAVIRHWQENGPALKQSATSHQLMETLANYPVGRPPNSWEDIESGAHSKKWVEHIRTVFNEPSFVPFLPCGMSEGRWFWNMFEDFIPSEYYDKSANSTYWLTLSAWSKKIAVLRNRDLRGRFPWKPESLGCNWYHSSDGTHAEWDMHLLIETLLWDHEDSERWNYTSDEFGDDDENGHRSFKLHQNFWIAAEREGFPEFANAMFAFYLMRKAIFDKRHHTYLNVDWPAFSELVRSALNRPGHRWVRKAVELMKSYSAEKSWNLDGLRLRNLVPDSAQLYVFPPISEIREVSQKPRRDCEKRIESEVGPDLWGRFSDRSRKLMVDAEVRFVMHAPGLGLVLSDIGSEVMSYAKPFECELDCRLNDIYGSSLLKKFWTHRFGREPQRNPTLGTYREMLENADKMPPELVSEIESKGVMLHRNAELLKQLKDLLDMRNPASHGKKRRTPTSQLVDMRSLVFTEGLLRRFLESLSAIQ